MANLSQFITGELTNFRTKLNAIVDAMDNIGGTLAAAGQVYLGADGGADPPYIRLRDVGASGIDVRVLDDAGVVSVQLNSGTESVPVWTTWFNFDLTNSILYVGNAGQATAGKLHIIDGGADKPGLLVPYDAAGADYFLWVDTNGWPRLHTAAPTNEDADGFILAGQKVPARHVAADTDLGVGDFYIGVTDTAAPRAVQLLSAIVANGRGARIKDESGVAGTNNITVTTEGAETIDGAATAVISTNYGSVDLISDGTNWFIV